MKSFLAVQVLMQFLLDYPVGGARLKRHLAFLLSNLAYEHEEVCPCHSKGYDCRRLTFLLPVWRHLAFLLLSNCAYEHEEV